MDRPVADLVAADFDHLRRSLAKRFGPARLGDDVKRVRGVFRYGHDAGLIEQPIRYGPTFRGPSRRTMRVERAKRGPQMFEAQELRRMLDAATMPLRAMILLAINCGFGNTDIASLPTKAVDLKNSWVTFARGKTGIGRRCPLWPETVAAVAQALDDRPVPSSPSIGS